MKKTELLGVLLIATCPLVGMCNKEADAVEKVHARDKIRLLVRGRYEFEKEMPQSVCLRWFVVSNRLSSPAGLLIGTPKDFAQSSYPLILRGTDDSSHIGLMVFSPWFVTLPLGVQRGLLLKMLYHVRQYRPNHGPLTVDPIRYPKGINQEAAAQALLNLRCLPCARDFMRSLPEESSVFFTPAEADELLKTMDQAQVCAYHKDCCERG